MPTLRKRLLVDEWVVVAPERADRPRQLGISLDAAGDFCPFCPENKDVTPPTLDTWSSPAFDEPWGVRAVPNKFPALRVEEQLEVGVDSGASCSVYEQRGGVGAHEVIIEAPDHHTSWADLPASHLAQIFLAWQQRMDDLRRDQRLRCAIVFKNHGAAAGATLEHIHSQLVALPIVPAKLRRELDGARHHYEQHGQCALCEMIEHERSTGERIIAENDSALAVAPYGSRMAFETWILPSSHGGNFLDSTADELYNAAELAGRIVALWDDALGPLAHNLVLHCLPFDLADEPYYHWHLEMIPRTGQIAGFELGSDIFINATPSEVAAHHLRNLDTQSG